MKLATSLHINNFIQTFHFVLHEKSLFYFCVRLLSVFDVDSKSCVEFLFVRVSEEVLIRIEKITSSFDLKT